MRYAKHFIMMAFFEICLVAAAPAAQAQQAKITRTPADVFNSITAGQYGWQFSGNAISTTFAADGQTLTAVDVPDGTL